MENAALVLCFMCIGVHLIGAIRYKAAVVEFSPTQTDLPSDRIKKNLDGFEKALGEINDDVQIVAFPEDGILGELFISRKAITPYLENIPDIPPSTSNFVNPCADDGFKDRPILQGLSCLAQQYSVVLVANMGDIQKCENSSSNNCPSDGHFQFNTNVVFESDGSLIAKYHKINLYANEKNYFDSGRVLSGTSCVSFQTSFGVRFGTFTCYDLLFSEPANCLLSKGIKNFILPTAWGSAFPFYMSIAVQQSWSRKHSVNFMASNQNFKRSYSTGSGIYSSGYALRYLVSGTTWEASSGRAISAELSSDPTTPMSTTQIGNLTNIDEIISKDRTYLNYTLFSAQSGSVSTTYTSTSGFKLNCKLDYAIETAAMVKPDITRQEFYALGAYIGPEGGDTSLQNAVCTMVKCNAPNECGDPVDGYLAKTVFQEVHLSGTFPVDSEVYASALDSGLELLSPTSLSFTNNILSIMDHNKPLLCANLWARLQ